MNVSEATATIVKAALDNKLLSFREPDSFSENSLAENNSFILTLTSSRGILLPFSYI